MVIGPVGIGVGVMVGVKGGVSVGDGVPVGVAVAVGVGVGVEVSELRYTAWGEVRFESGTTPTEYTYTGQYREGYIKLLNYVSRRYDPELGRFIQPDSIVPLAAQGVQAFDRFAYANNNPIRYNDPLGHSICGGENGDCTLDSDDYKKHYKQTIKDKYDWNIHGDNWSVDELSTILQTGRDIEKYANSVTGGNGIDWMLFAFGNVTIHNNFQSSDGHSDAWPFLGQGSGRIRLDQNWLTHRWGANVLLAHELGHIWDYHSGFAASGELNRDLGGSSWCYFCAPGDGVPQWEPSYHRHDGNAYGNSSRNEYFAEAFSTTVYEPTKSPPGVSDWIGFQITSDLYKHLFPLGVRW